MRNLLLGLTMSALPASACADAFDVYGIWLTQAEDAHIEVTYCGDGTPCGDLVWVDPITVESQQDIHNDNSEQRGRLLIGAHIVWGMCAVEKTGTTDTFTIQSTGKPMHPRCACKKTVR